MSNADWYARKLANPQPTAVLTPGTRMTPMPMHTPSYVPQVQNRPMGSPVNVPQPPKPRDLSGIPLNEGERQDLLNPDLPPDAKIGFSEAMRRWRGGQAHRTEGNQYCPSCGSGLVSHRAAGAMGGNTPAPHCFSCGWNGKYMQGSEGNWVG